MMNAPCQFSSMNAEAKKSVSKILQALLTSFGGAAHL